ncbi:MAG: hypothetical protein H6654_03225 [Ardenticatenaceae bacterium]|nr:hypothetical protein [Ardenticatenaceae bacterium]
MPEAEAIRLVVEALRAGGAGSNARSKLEFYGNGRSPCAILSRRKMGRG